MQISSCIDFGGETEVKTSTEAAPLMWSLSKRLKESMTFSEYDINEEV